jgi:hypothetical protein
MKSVTCSLLLIIVSISLAFSQNNVKSGYQGWLSKNLIYDQFRNVNLIKLVTVNEHLNLKNEINELVDDEESIQKFLGKSKWKVQSVHTRGGSRGWPLEKYLKVSFSFNRYMLLTYFDGKFMYSQHSSSINDIEKLSNGFFRFTSLVGTIPIGDPNSRNFGAHRPPPMEKHSYEIIDENTIEAVMNKNWFTLKRLK